MTKRKLKSEKHYNIVRTFVTPPFSDGKRGKTQEIPGKAR